MTAHGHFATGFLARAEGQTDIVLLVLVPHGGVVPLADAPLLCRRHQRSIAPVLGQLERTAVVVF